MFKEFHHYYWKYNLCYKLGSYVFSFLCIYIGFFLFLFTYVFVIYLISKYFCNKNISTNWIRAAFNT